MAPGFGRFAYYARCVIQVALELTDELDPTALATIALASITVVLSVIGGLALSFTAWRS